MFSTPLTFSSPANLAIISPTIYTDGSTSHIYTVTSLSTGESYTYDANENTPAPGAGAGVITRVEGGVTYNQTFDAENRLISITVGTSTTSFVYDGDGNPSATLRAGLVKKINPDNTKTIYVAGIYEVNKNSGGTVTSTKTYYPAGGAMRVDGTRYYILKDHLGSASVVMNQSAVWVGEDRFYPFGETRLSSGNMQTDKLFTGQREITGLDIYFFNARFYSPKLGRFLSPDTIVQSYANPQSLNRFSYVLNNPILYNDPTGHVVCEVGDHCGARASYVKETSYAQMAINMRKRMKDKYGVTLVDGGRSWDLKNIYAVYAGMYNIDKALDGQTKNILGSAMFTLSSHEITGHYGGHSYPGITNFFISSTIPLQNLYHEVGHLLNYAMNNMLEKRVNREAHYADGNYIFGGSGGEMNATDPSYGFKSNKVPDPNLGSNIVDALQHPETDPSEQWADLFANYVAGNINMTSRAGQEIFTFVNRSLMPDLSLTSGR